MLDLNSLLGRGYFPAKIPAPFSTQRFADVVSTCSRSLPRDFYKPCRSKTLQHNQARVGINRRLLGVPNPTVQLNLCLDMVNHWSELDPLTKRSKISKSNATIASAELPRALVPQYSQDNLATIRLATRSRCKHILKADIANYYASVYTHSIPWAIHGKSFAKNNRGFKHVGNSIDRWVRRGQDDQSIGIPIGPDTSFLISELILNAADEEITQKLDFLSGFRHYDDFEFGFDSRTRAETALTTLRLVLREEYQLELNSGKTLIVDMPARIEARWVSGLRGFHFRSTPRAQATDLMTFFDLAFELSPAYPDDHVLQYAAARFRLRDAESFKVDSTHWRLIENFLLHCLTIETGTFLVVLEVFIQYHEQGYQIDLCSLGWVLNRQLVIQCEAGYASEAAWAVWALIYFGIPVNKDAARALSTCQDSFVALLALDAQERGLIPSGLDTTLWLAFMDEPSLYDSQWLLSYEANVKGWLPSKNTRDHVASDKCFGFLKSEGVQFYDDAKVPTSVPPGVDVDGDWIEPLIQDLFY